MVEYIALVRNKNALMFGNTGRRCCWFYHACRYFAGYFVTPPRPSIIKCVLDVLTNKTKKKTMALCCTYSYAIAMR